ncbi:hypothetical protein LINGRAHAP2_LOCUS16621 [Linum grandiflorum]
MMKTKEVALFQPGDRVEVLGHEEGFQGSRFEAFVVESLDSNLYEVKYATLIKEEGSPELVTETVSGELMRPYPPSIGRFKVMGSVEVWVNEGWWAGKVNKIWVEDGLLMCRVYFGEPYWQEIDYPVSLIRPRLELGDDGTWRRC